MAVLAPGEQALSQDVLSTDRIIIDGLPEQPSQELFSLELIWLRV